MERILQTIVTLMSSVLIALGGPANTPVSPDRPAIVQVPPALAPVSLVYNTRGTIQEVRDGEIIVDGTKFTIERETEIHGDLSVGETVDIEAKSTGDRATVALSVQVQKRDDSSASSTANVSTSAKDDTSRADEQLKEKASDDVKADLKADDSPDGAQHQDEAIKAEDSKSPDSSATQVEKQDDKPMQQQVESRDDSTKSQDSGESHTETRSGGDSGSDNHGTERQSNDDHKSKDSRD